MRQLFFTVGLWAVCSIAAAGSQVQLQGVRLWAAPDHTRIVFDISAPLSHKIITLKNPRRVVIDLKDARLTTTLKNLKHTDGRIKKIRSGIRGGNDLRLVLEVAHAVRPKAFLLPPNATYGNRLVVDLYDTDKAGDTGKPAKSVKKKTITPFKSIPSKSIGFKANREVVIAIDPGHGGEDPGARGPKGVLEKTVVLEMAQKLAALIKREPGMRPVMLRHGDYYVGLRSRVKKARKAQADLLISIHADSFSDPRVHGSSVYVVSRRGASNEMARWLAERENASDLAGGVSLDDKDDVLKSVLLDLSQSASMEASLDVAGDVLRQLKPLGKVHKSTVQQAGFMVLKSPDIPSILVETAFISNPGEERRLQNPRHQQKVARAIFNGVREHFKRVVLNGDQLAGAQHLIQRGDTLSEIAELYNVSVKNIKVANRISRDALRVGDVLEIPPSSGG